jgi:putative oxygen-independent coproporphyrinogen III oxidase
LTQAGGAPDLGLYLHWPWCARICPYCDFNVLRDRGEPAAKAALVDAMLQDIAAHARRLGPRRLVSIFFGGGTPSRMDPADVARLIDAARRAWPGSDELEVSLEANPDDAEPGRWAELARAGVNRLSLGVQSFDDANLKALGRNHDAARALAAARLAGSIFPRLSIDMIWGLPGQACEAWAADLATCVALGPEHVSAYELTFEPGTAFDRARRRGALTPPDEGRRADLYALTNQTLGDAGYGAYEVSNHARGPAAQARHNLIYWRGQDYVGVGPGAHGRLTLGDARWAAAAPKRLGDYIARVARHGLGADLERLDGREVAIERLLMGLRIDEGVDLTDLAALAIPEDRFAGLDGLVRREGGRLVAATQGRAVLDAVIRALVA